MPVPAYVDDGNFSELQQNGAPVYAFPFAIKGDVKSFTAKVKMRADADNIVLPVGMAQRVFPQRGRGYFVDIDQPQDLGQGLLEYTLTYASVPLQRIEYGRVVYLVQPNDPAFGQLRRSAVGIYESSIYYDYSVFQPLPQLIATVTIGVGGSQPTLIIGKQVPPARGLRLVVNSTSRIYMGQIFERQSIYANIAAPRILNLGS